MRKSTMRLAVVSACVGAGLVLSACGGGADDAAEADTAAEEQAGTEDGGADDSAAEEAAAPATEDDLVAAVEAGGFSAQVTDTGDLGDAAGAMSDMTVEPQECEVFMNAAMAAAEDMETTVVVGTPSDPSVGTFAGAIGYPSADDAAGAIQANSGSLGTCSEITVSGQGMEISSSTTEVDASVDGAEDVFASEISMDLSGQSMTTTSVQAVKGSAIITVTTTSGAGLEGASIDDLSATAADMIAALP